MSISLAFLSRDPAPVTPTRRWPAWLFPGAILAAFALLFATLYQDRLLPATPVRVAPVLATPAQDDTASEAATTASAPENTAPLLFQASGWVEPDPYAIKASSLIDGVIAEVLVLEGQTVAQGELIARLVDADAKLKLAAAEGKLRMLTVEKTAQVSAVQAGQAVRASIQAEVAAVETLATEAKDQCQRLDGLKEGGAVSQSDVIAARLRWQREQANLAAAQAKLEAQQAEIAQLEAATAAKVEEIALAQVAVAQEQLALERTQIRAPIAGRILKLLAVPGEKKMLAMDHPDSSVVAILYDPGKLQIRVDVPLADAAGLTIGQPARVHCQILPEQTFTGEVTRISGEADLQRNTLQAKVRLLALAEVLRPEMLCRVEFLRPATANVAATGAAASQGLHLWVPQEALQDSQVWVVDLDTYRLQRRTVQPTTETREQYVRIQSGLQPGEPVVLAPANLREGQRVSLLPPTL